MIISEINQGPVKLNPPHKHCTNIMKHCQETCDVDVVLLVFSG